MQCLSCSNDVSPKFAHALKTNVCPMCGEQIMVPELHNALRGLQTIMDEAIEQAYDAQVVQWFSSNFDLVSRASEEFVELHKTIEQLTNELRIAKEKPMPLKAVPKSARTFPQADEIKLGVDEEGNQIQLQGPSIQDPDV